jgi:predicted MFS family arabinose efflux permease
MLWATGAFAVYTYLASFLERAAGLTGSSVSAELFMWGVAAVIGLRFRRASDNPPPSRS